MGVELIQAKPIARDLEPSHIDYRGCDVCEAFGVEVIEIAGNRACGYCGNSIQLCPGCAIRMVREARL